MSTLLFVAQIWQVAKTEIVKNPLKDNTVNGPNGLDNLAGLSAKSKGATTIGQVRTQLFGFANRKQTT